jgi:predicted transcriptional regulator
VLPIQCRMARTALGLGVRDLAKIAKVGVASVARFEAEEDVRESTVGALRAALEKAGVEFIPENGGGPGVRLAKRKKPSTK